MERPNPIHGEDASAGAETGQDHAAADEAAEAGVLEPLADYPHIDLRAGGEPWDKRRAAGKRLREVVDHAAHAALDLPADRPDPVDLIAGAHEGRQPELVPLRVARMASSPFAFLRGAAHVMAWDLAHSPRSEIMVVMNGDAHISNFGLFGTPQGDVVLDLNDFDEVTIGPWEWDLKRLVASIEVAAREDGVPADQRRQAVMAAVGGYQHTMLDLAPQGSLDVWQQATRADELDFSGVRIDEASQAVVRKAVEKARKKNNQSLLARVGERRVDGGWRFREDAPILTRVDDDTRESVITGLEHYAETLLCGNSDQDVLFLQVKEAVRPAHAPYLPGMPEPYASHEGERVIYGQRLL
ncbi:DUF2252 domain-containing protein, partial [Methylobacterium sp. WL30]|uniref:DUF2252 family protein n=1 Tax=Methylobacterium sp. WL30 TaxID=2603895 RepID=UPI0011CB65A9